MNNIIHVIIPYKHGNQWVFDDSMKGLEREPFVAGSGNIIDVLVKDIEHADSGFTMLFSDRLFPGYQYTFSWNQDEMNGNWYSSKELGMRGWLCPALLKYFSSPPDYIYVQVKA